MLHVKKASRGKSGDHISVSDSGEPFEKITVRMGMPGTILVTISRVLVPTAGEKMALRESLMTSNNSASPLLFGTGAIRSSRKDYSDSPTVKAITAKM